jgi:hypothetical protein
MSIENSFTENVQKPKEVRIAIFLLYAYSVVSILIDSTLSIINGYFFSMNILYQVVIFLGSVFLIFTISKGKAWPRNVFLLFLLLGTFLNLGLLFNIPDEFKYMPIRSIIKYSLGLIPIIFLYLKPARQWFGAVRENTIKAGEKKRVAPSIFLASLVSAPFFDFFAGIIGLPSLNYACGGMLLSPLLAVMFSLITGTIGWRFMVKKSEHLVRIGLLCGFFAGISAAIILYPGAC